MGMGCRPPLPTGKVGCAFSEETFAGACSNGEDAP